MKLSHFRRNLHDRELRVRTRKFPMQSLLIFKFNSLEFNKLTNKNMLGLKKAFVLYTTS